MPEGDTVWRAANTLRAALEGQQLTVCDIRVPRYATVDFTGETVESVASRGKHLLIRVGGYSIHSHLKMEGTWHVYALGARWRRPAFQARIILNTEKAQAIGFELGVLEILENEDDAVGYLGPDLPTRLGPRCRPDQSGVGPRPTDRPGPARSAQHSRTRQCLPQRDLLPSRSRSPHAGRGLRRPEEDDRPVLPHHHRQQESQSARHHRGSSRGPSFLGVRP